MSHFLPFVSSGDFLKCKQFFVGAQPIFRNFPALQSTSRFVEKHAEQVSEMLEELVYSEESNLSKLRLIWDSEIIKKKIMEEVTRHLRRVANQGRTLEQAAR